MNMNMTVMHNKKRLLIFSVVAVSFLGESKERVRNYLKCLKLRLLHMYDLHCTRRWYHVYIYIHKNLRFIHWYTAGWTSPAAMPGLAKAISKLFHSPKIVFIYPYKATWALQKRSRFVKGSNKKGRGWNVVTPLSLSLSLSLRHGPKVS